ncbi:MAG TPA: SDR family oxidoreductase [Ktedonobacterales bacterium]|jgi:NAD(P)-dependent dehydrogenase (short-subunit alcohol dehydrogenase family)
MLLQDTVVLITGSSKGLGRALAHAYAGAGARVVINARGAEALEATRNELVAKPGHQVAALPADATQPGDIARLVDFALTRYGRIDVLINNAGILGPSPRPNMADFHPDDLAEIFRANVTGPVLMTQAVLPQMLARQRGLIINVTSDAGQTGYPGWGGYGAAKAALELITESWAAELEGTGVRVNAVNPGDLQTEMHQLAFPGEDISDRLDPFSVTDLFVWLASDAAANVTGQRFDAPGFKPPES